MFLNVLFYILFCIFCIWRFFFDLLHGYGVHSDHKHISLTVKNHNPTQTKKGLLTNQTCSVNVNQRAVFDVSDRRVAHKRD